MTIEWEVFKKRIQPRLPLVVVAEREVNGKKVVVAEYPRNRLAKDFENIRQLITLNGWRAMIIRGADPYDGNHPFRVDSIYLSKEVCILRVTGEKSEAIRRKWQRRYEKVIGSVQLRWNETKKSFIWNKKRDLRR
jgi:hypothetical protein